MKITEIVVILIGILTVLLVCLALGETTSSEWTTVATQAAPAIVALGFFAIVIAAIVSRR